MARGPGRKAATLSDVAAAAGLSPAAISLALRGKAGVSEATRARVLEVARSMGYRPANGSVSRQHHGPLTVTLVIRALHGDSPDANRFYGPVLGGIEERCRRLHIRLMFAIMPVDQHNHPIEIPHAVVDQSSDGLILVGAHLTPEAQRLLTGSQPAVLVDAYAEDGLFDSVDTDNLYGGRTATEHLIGNGHRDIAILGTAADAFPSILDRRRGYEEALQKAGLTPHYIDVPYYQHEQAAEAAIEYLQANPEVTGLFCANDFVAVTFIQAARQAGISVPDRVSVVGFDDIDLASIMSPALTTMAVDKPGMGRLAVTLLAHRIEVGKNCVSCTLVRPELIERETVRTIGHAVNPPESATRPAGTARLAGPQPLPA